MRKSMEVLQRRKTIKDLGIRCKHVDAACPSLLNLILNCLLCLCDKENFQIAGAPSMLLYDLWFSFNKQNVCMQI